MKDKTVSEKLQGYWILGISELNGMKKIDVETIKSFVSQTDDKYRQANGSFIESHPRSCIIVGTTNSDSGFLCDITGNHRFFPINITGTGKYHPWELTEVDQIWSEDVEYYKRGEELFLKGEIAMQAYEKQRDAMESDDREGIVEEYLNPLLPDEWVDMDLYERRNYLNGTEFGEVKKHGTETRDKISVRGSGNILRKHSKAVGGQPCSAVVSYVSEKLYYRKNKYIKRNSNIYTHTRTREF